MARRLQALVACLAAIVAVSNGLKLKDRLDLHREKQVVLNIDSRTVSHVDSLLNQISQPSFSREVPEFDMSQYSYIIDRPAIFMELSEQVHLGSFDRNSVTAAAFLASNAIASVQQNSQDGDDSRMVHSQYDKFLEKIPEISSMSTNNLHLETRFKAALTKAGLPESREPSVSQMMQRASQNNHILMAQQALDAAKAVSQSANPNTADAQLRAMDVPTLGGANVALDPQLQLFNPLLEDESSFPAPRVPSGPASQDFSLESLPKMNDVEVPDPADVEAEILGKKTARFGVSPGINSFLNQANNPFASLGLESSTAYKALQDMQKLSPGNAQQGGVAGAIQAMNEIGTDLNAGLNSLTNPVKSSASAALLSKRLQEMQALAVISADIKQRKDYLDRSESALMAVENELNDRLSKVRQQYESKLDGARNKMNAVKAEIEHLMVLQRDAVSQVNKVNAEMQKQQILETMQKQKEQLQQALDREEQLQAQVKMSQSSRKELEDAIRRLTQQANSLTDGSSLLGSTSSPSPTTAPTPAAGATTAPTPAPAPASAASFL